MKNETNNIYNVMTARQSIYNIGHELLYIEYIWTSRIYRTAVISKLLPNQDFPCRLTLFYFFFRTCHSFYFLIFFLLNEGNRRSSFSLNIYSKRNSTWDAHAHAHVHTTHDEMKKKKKDNCLFLFVKKLLENSTATENLKIKRMQRPSQPKEASLNSSTGTASGHRSVWCYRCSSFPYRFL